MIGGYKTESFPRKIFGFYGARVFVGEYIVERRLRNGYRGVPDYVSHQQQQLSKYTGCGAVIELRFHFFLAIPASLNRAQLLFAQWRTAGC